MSAWGDISPDLTDGEALMTRHEAAVLLGATSEAVARWARSGRLPEIRDDDGHPRYRRADVEALYRLRTAPG